MRFNSAQKAQQALEALAADGPRETRLRNAYGHLVLAGSPDYAQDSVEIIEAFKKATAAMENEDWDYLSQALQEMIGAIFQEEGANKVRSDMGDDIRGGGPPAYQIPPPVSQRGRD